jgi:TRAP-type mannitol/chloroaromatic compound transport system permease large subunit
MLTSAVRDTTLTTAMIMFIAIGATAFSVIFKQIGGTHMIEDMVDSLSLGPYGTVLFVLVIIFFMGFFLEWIEISYIILPIFGPIVAGLDLGLGSGSQNLVWFAVLMAVNMQTSFLTPPLGFSLFYLKGIAPPGFGMADIYRGIVPFVLLQLVALILVFFYPALAIWLPAVMSN